MLNSTLRKGKHQVPQDFCIILLEPEGLSNAIWSNSPILKNFYNGKISLKLKDRDRVLKYMESDFPFNTHEGNSAINV